MRNENRNQNEKLNNKGEKEMKTKLVTVDENSFVDNADYTAQEQLDFFVRGEGNFDWHYNITRDVFGYGDDGEEWDSAGDEWIDNYQMISVDCVEDFTCTYLISYEDVEQSGLSGLSGGEKDRY